MSDFWILDTSALVMLVSGICHTPSSIIYHNLEDLEIRNPVVARELKRQLDSEKSAKLLSQFRFPKQLLAPQTAFEEALNIVLTLGNKQERERFGWLFLTNAILIIRDRASELLENVQLSKSVSMNDKLIFGTALSLQYPILTSDAKFVRAVQQKGVTLDAIIHPPRSLLGALEHS